MPKLNDTQTILLSAASQRDDGNLYPLPDGQAPDSATFTKALTALVKSGLVDKRADNAAFITPAGLRAIGVSDSVEPNDTPAASPPASGRTTKTDLVIDLLKRDEGANLTDLIAATGWLPHTTRAALTGLRKKGHAIERFKHDKVTTYRIGR